MKKIKTGKTSRFLSLGGSLAKASTSYLFDKARGKIDQERITAAKKIINSMSNLKGGWMKIGQMLSLTDSEILPKEISELFKVLQKDSQALKFEEIENIIKREWGDLYKKHIDFIDPNPYASASIGQVHQAKLKDGSKVAVKVQYDGIEQAIRNDMENIDRFDMALSLLFKNKPNFKLLLSELQDNLILECNYLREANQQTFFKQKLESEFSNIYVPKVLDQLCTKRILVTEWLEGDSFEASCEYPQEIQDKLGETLYESFLYSFFVLNKIHADPQDGNFLFQQDKIIFLDFGCIKDFDIGFVQDYALLQYSVEKNDINLYKYSAKKLNIIQEQDSESFVKNHFDLVKKVYQPYVKEGKYRADFPNALGLIRDFIFQVNWKERVQPKKDFVLLDRNNVGLFMKLKKWNPKIDWEKGRQKYRTKSLKDALKLYRGPIQ